MAVNGEEGNLKAFLRILPYLLRPGGRAAIITFHPVEDRLVETAFAEGAAGGIYRAPVPEAVHLIRTGRDDPLRVADVRIEGVGAVTVGFTVSRS